MRRILAFILAAVILLPAVLPQGGAKQASAAASDAEKVISALDIMKTDKGEIGTDAARITRGQFAQLLVNMSSLKDTVAASSNVSLYSDVSRKYWAAGYIKTAVSNGWMSGYLNGSFKPDSGVTLLEAVNGILKLLGYTDSDFTGNTTENKMALYISKKLNKNITVTGTSSYLGYSNCVNLFYNTLNATTKDGKVYAEVLGYSLDSDGKLDYLSLINTGTEGPIVAQDSWTSDLPFSIYGATFYKNDAKCTYYDIDKYDVLYYSETFETVWAYDKKVTGIISAISPDLLNPTSVTVAGVEYEFETSTASLEFASLGQFEKGDVVTLLLGKNGGIAGVLSLDEYNTTITGLVLNTGYHVVLNDEGNSVSTAYVTYVDSSGNTYTQDYDSSTLNFEKEDLIRISYENGMATVSELDAGNYGLDNAAVNSDGTALGTMKFSSTIKILDYCNGAYITVYPIRLADMIIMNSEFYYYSTNANGEITDLILQDATGDLDKYGIFTGFSFSGNAAAYSYIIDGASGALSTSSYDDFTFTEGPAGFKYEDGSIVSVYELTGITVSSIGNTTVASGAEKYPLAEKISVYILSDGEYVETTIDKINLSEYKVTAYCDKAITLGGRIRVIIAQSIY